MKTKKHGHEKVVIGCIGCFIDNEPKRSEIKANDVSKAKPTHTPGPWHRNINTKYPVYSGETPETFVYVAHVVSKNDADLSLIAAAPELLEALRGEHDRAVELDLGEMSFKHKEKQCDTCLLIAKAEGGK